MKAFDTPHVAAVFKSYPANSQSSLVQTFKERFPSKLRYKGNRSILFRVDARIPAMESRRCISIALTYHRDKKPPRSARMGRL